MNDDRAYLFKGMKTSDNNKFKFFNSEGHNFKCN